MRLINFDARPTRAGVTYRTGSGRAVVPHAFIRNLPNAPGKKAVFERVSLVRPGRRGRKHSWLPIRQLMGPSLSRVAAERHILEASLKVGEVALHKNYRSELKFALREAGKGV